MSSVTRGAWICISIGLVMAGIVWFMNQVSTNENSSQRTQVKAVEEPVPAYSIDDQALGRTIQAILDENADLNLSVSLIDLQTSKQYHYGETANYTAASIGKLITASMYLRQVELGKATLDEIVGDAPAQVQLEKLIVKSDNPAWHHLNDRLTTEGLQEYANSIGLTDYDAASNTMTSSDVARLLDKLCSGALLEDEYSKMLFSWMQQADQKDYIMAAIPGDAVAYHKTGYLSDRLHDAAVIKKGDRSFVLVIFSKSTGSYDFYRGAGVFGGITKASLQAFFEAP